MYEKKYLLNYIKRKKENADEIDISWHFHNGFLQNKLPKTI